MLRATAISLVRSHGIVDAAVHSSVPPSHAIVGPPESRNATLLNMSGQLPTRLLRFIRGCIPTYQSAEVLLFFAAHPDEAFLPEEIVASMHPKAVTVSAVQEYSALFAASGVVTEQDGRYAYAPATPDLEGAIGDLTRAYNERPVTLIRTIYKIADSRIQSFADSFKLRED